MAALTVAWATPAKAEVYVSTGHHYGHAYGHRHHYHSSRVVVLEDRPSYRYRTHYRNHVYVERNTIAFGGHHHHSYHHHDRD